MQFKGKVFTGVLNGVRCFVFTTENDTEMACSMLINSFVRNVYAQAGNNKIEYVCSKPKETVCVGEVSITACRRLQPVEESALKEEITLAEKYLRHGDLAGFTNAERSHSLRVGIIFDQ